MSRANKMSRLGALHFNLAIFKTDAHAKGTPGLPLANRAVAGPNLSGPSEDFVSNRATLARAFIAAPHLSSPPHRSKHWIKIKNRKHPAFDRVQEAHRSRIG
jgi:hypothetical protein